MFQKFILSVVKMNFTFAPLLMVKLFMDDTCPAEFLFNNKNNDAATPGNMVGVHSQESFYPRQRGIE
ncbi:MAG: hypothetical protein JST17_14635 [Bacteroidetes bacterium]|nr:hypothetical protein [Bacteroidota bacterium]